VGHGASGRNGGWSSAPFPAPPEALASLPGSSDSAARAQHAAMVGSIDEVGRVVAEEGIECGWTRGGSVVLARSAPQEARARREVEHARRWGRDLTWLDADAARTRLAATGVRGATWTPDCAVLQPLALVRGVAASARARGAVLHERSPVTHLAPHEVRTASGHRVRADVVVRATEGWTPTLPGLRRTVAPTYSLVIATEPLAPEIWDRIGLRERETFSDHRHLIVYGQRTADDRLVFGGRGAPYHWGSRVRPSQDHDRRVFAGLHATLLEMLPLLAGVRITHQWGGPLGIPRDWCASVGLDPSTGMAWAGGYVGDGVTTTNLAGRTLRDLVLGEETGLTALPWVGHRSRAWEPEPLRWLGVNRAVSPLLP
jgi:glycine/D-amino acid oxidase-like deaminating enzyme